MGITYSKITNPRYVTGDKSAICVEVTFDGLPDLDGKSINGETVTFCAMPTDTEQHGKDIYEAAMKGDYGKIADYVAPDEAAKPVPMSDRLDKIEAALKAAKMM